MTTSEFVIQCTTPDHMGEAQFWNNDHGWTNLTEATVFTEAERDRMGLPGGALCWVQLPQPEALTYDEYACAMADVWMEEMGQ
jgi:hypothetical protein